METKKLVELKNKLIANGYITIYRDIAKGFIYTKDNKFGKINKNIFGEIELCSVYVPNKYSGNGTLYRTLNNPTLNDIEASLNYTFKNDKPKFYKNLEDFLKSYYFLYESFVENKEGIKSALSYLQGKYIFISEKHYPIVTDTHKEAISYYDKCPNDIKKVVYEILDYGVETLNHNLNVHSDEESKTYFKILSKISNPLLEVPKKSTLEKITVSNKHGTMDLMVGIRD